MSESTVSAALPQREPGAALNARVGDLLPGDWIACGELDEDETAEIRYVETYRDEFDTPRCRGFYRVGSNFEPVQFDLAPSTPLRLATALEIETTRRDRQRGKIAAKFRHLADLVEQQGFPVGDEFDQIKVEIRLVNVDDVRRVAEAIGGESKSDGRESFVEWPAAPSPVVRAVWKAYDPSIVADPLGRGFGRNEVAEPVFVTGEVPDYVRGATALGVVHEAEQDRAVGTASVPGVAPIDPDSSMEAHYDAEVEARR